jgi:sigma-B regulation protein RsbU (phosphoserine phosphatase)
MVRQRLIGVLCVCNASDGLPFSETDYSLVKVLAEQAGLAVHNADFLALQVDKQRLDLDLALASDVQKMILPRTMPAVPGLDIDARYFAAQMVSGDLYDVFKLGYDRIGVAVADVSGKGVSASLLMAICRTTLRQIAPAHSSPARVLAELNRSLAGDMSEGMYITMTYAVVDAGRNLVTLARAGHELSLVSRCNPKTGLFLSEFVGSEGMPVGLVDAELFDSVIEDKTLEFPLGSTLLLYTDGLTEAPNADGKEFGSARLADALRFNCAGSAKVINDGILAKIEQFTKCAAIRDDFTIMTVKRV